MSKIILDNDKKEQNLFLFILPYIVVFIMDLFILAEVYFSSNYKQIFNIPENIKLFIDINFIYILMSILILNILISMFLSKGKKRIIEIIMTIVNFFAGFVIYSALIMFSMAKPAIYIYPIEDMNVNVSLDINGKITKSIPNYNNGWKVFVNKEGYIKNIKGNSQISYDYLFYENTLNKIEKINEAWFVKKENLNDWFNRNLSKMGLNEREKIEFLNYWIPRLKNTKNKYIRIQLFSEDFLEKNMKLVIKPKPEKILRLEFLFKGVNFINEKIKEPKIRRFERTGYYVVEWGGGILK